MPLMCLDRLHQTEQVAFAIFKLGGLDGSHRCHTIDRL